jgi:cytochrome c oxidase subunit 2
MASFSFRSRFAAILALGALAFLLSGCEELSSPQNTFAPIGEVAEKQRDYFILVMWPALVIGVIVLAACVYIPLRFIHRQGDPLPRQVHGNTPLELTWTIIPAIIMAVVGGITVAGIIDLGREPRADALKVDVTGVRYRWDFTYPDYTDGAGNPVAGSLDEAGVAELRIPVDREVGLYVIGADVIHSFWVPKLAGKIDAVPNHPNRIWVKADTTGTFEGQCAEFCGLDHSVMRMKLIVRPEEEFDAWVSEQQAAGRPGAPGDGDDVQASGE